MPENEKEIEESPIPPAELESDETPEALVCNDDTVEHFHERQFCIQCHRVYCPHFGSEIDSNFCRVCLTSDKATVHIQPLKDEEGIHHEGKWIFPIGSVYKTLPRAIAEMSNDELENYLRFMRQQVKNAETTLQYRRIAESIAGTEHEHRKVLEDRRLKGIKMPKVANAGVKVESAPSVSKKKDLGSIVETLKALNISVADLQAVLAAKQKKI